MARVLARRQVLLVLDNCEHVIGAAAELCAGLLLAADDVRILATSREPLAVPGEAWDTHPRTPARKAGLHLGRLAAVLGTLPGVRPQSLNRRAGGAVVHR